LIFRGAAAVKVAAVTVNDYSCRQKEYGLLETLKLVGGLAGYVKSGEMVLIKPNILAGILPEKAVAPHP
jgi:uncharacterized protein (DUF362 family)